VGSLGYQVFDAEDEIVETGDSELSCLIGYGVLFPALEEKARRPRPGASRTVLLKPELTFGLRNPEAQVEVERSEFRRTSQPAIATKPRTRTAAPCCCRSWK